MTGERLSPGGSPSTAHAPSPTHDCDTELDELRRTSTSRYEFLADQLPLHVWQTDTAGRLLFLSRPAREFFERDVAEIAGVPLSTWMHEGDGRLWSHRFRGSLRTGEPLTMELRLKRADGSFRWHLIRAVARHDATGMRDGWVGTSTDIDDSKLAEIERTHLLAAEARARTVAERRERQARILAEAGSILAGSEEAEVRLQRFVDSMVPQLADLVMVEGLRSDGRVEVLGLAHIEPVVAEAILGARHKASGLWLSADQGPNAVRSEVHGMTLTTLHVALTTTSTEPFGVLVVGRHNEHATFSESQQETVIELGRRVALMLENARLYEEQRRIGRALQSSLLSGAGDAVSGLTTAVRYDVATSDAEVGGDWYDVFKLAGGRLGVVIGDVVGRGLAAASVMGKLRSALRALAFVHDDPGDVLTALDRFALSTEGAPYSSVVYTVLDPVDGLLTYASAGHPPPFIVAPDGSTTFLDGGRATLLGANGSDARRSSAVVTLAPGSTLVLYTDGLVERRGESIQVGMDRIAVAAIGSSGDGLEGLADSLLEACLDPSGHADDVALLVLRLELPGSQVFARRVPARLEVLPPLRAQLRSWLKGLGIDQGAMNDVLLACGEACANAAEHAYSGGVTGDVAMEARIAGGEILVTIRDSGHWRRAAVAGDRGRGQAMMRQLMDEVIVNTRLVGSSVFMRKRLEPSR